MVSGLWHSAPNPSILSTTWWAALWVLHRPLLPRPAHVIRATWGCVCLPGLAYWYVCSQTTAVRSRMSGWPKLIQKLSPRMFLLGYRTGRNGAWSSRGEGACLGACQEDRARAKDTHRPWDTPESPSPAAALQHSIPGPLVTWAGGSPNLLL